MTRVAARETVSRETHENLDADIRRHWTNAENHARLAVEEAWLAGRKLNEKRGALAHGEFLPWLESEGYSQSRAYRFMDLAERAETSQLGKFDSVHAALASLPPKRYVTACETILELWQQVFDGCETKEDRVAVLRLRPDGSVSAVRFLEVSGL